MKKCTLLSLGGAGGQTVHNRSTFGAPLKTYGHNASNELYGLFYQGDTEIGQNLHFYKTFRRPFPTITVEQQIVNLYTDSNRDPLMYSAIST